MNIRKIKAKEWSMRFSQKLRHAARKLMGEEHGVAYLEFALSLPFLLLLFGGSIDVTRMVLLHQKVDKAVFTVGDLATQLQIESGICNTIRGWETTVVRDMVKPFDWEAGNFEFIMSSVIGAGEGGDPEKEIEDFIEWRYNQDAVSVVGAFSSPYMSYATLPESIQGLAPNERVIVTEMKYQFKPMLPLLSGLEEAPFRKASYFRSRITTGTTAAGSGPLSKLGAC